MRLVFLGPPGVGKGTQASLFSESHNIPHVATGDLLRTAISKRTKVGLEASGYIESGKLVPDQVVIQLMIDRLGDPDAQSGYILDGFPRTIAQGESLSAVLEKKNASLDHVLYFSLDDKTLMERIVGRRSCPSCNAIYHVTHRKPTQEGVCKCGSALVQRKDDRPETVSRRLDVYKEETAPLISYYREQSILTEIKADGPFDAISKEIALVFQECSL